MHQYGALQLLLHVVAAAATLIVPEAATPRDGLKAIRMHGVTHVSATPTFWRFLLLEIGNGIAPSLAQVTLSGEAVPGPLLADLERRFPTARISQIYAASEFGSSAVVRDGRSGMSAEVLRRPGDADVAFRIEDGELWVRSRIGMLGYYGEPDTSDSDGWRPTGDRVEVMDNRIEFRGRVLDVINVGGVKVDPLSVETRVTEVPGVALARVYGRRNPLTGAIVAVDIVRERDATEGDVRAGVRAACVDLVPAAQPRSIRFVDTLTVSAGHKVIRRQQE